MTSDRSALDHIGQWKKISPFWANDLFCESHEKNMTMLYNILRGTFLSSAIIIFAVLVSGCKETLPLMNEPVLPLTGSVENYLSSVYYDNGYLAKGEFTVYPKVKNVYDETLQGYGEFKGKIELVWERDTSYRKTFTMNNNSLVDNRRYKYDPSTNLVTMDQNDEMGFFFQWDFTTDDGRRVDTAFALLLDYTCYEIAYLPRGKRFAVRFWNPRSFSIERFIVSGYIKPFKDLAAVQIPPHVIQFEYDNYKKSRCKSKPGGGN